MGGCIFRARPHGVFGFEGFSRSSMPLSTRVLPMLPASGIRLEVRLPNGAAELEMQEFELTILRVLGKELKKLTVVEKRLSPSTGFQSMYIVFDLEGANLAYMARTLAAAIFKGNLRAVDVRYGLIQVMPYSDETTRVPATGNAEVLPHHLNPLLKFSLLTITVVFLVAAGLGYPKLTLERYIPHGSGIPGRWLSGERSGYSCVHANGEREIPGDDFPEAQVSLLRTAEDSAPGDETPASTINGRAGLSSLRDVKGNSVSLAVDDHTLPATYPRMISNVIPIGTAYATVTLDGGLIGDCGGTESNTAEPVQRFRL